MLKTKISNGLRSIKLLFFADKMRFHISKYKGENQNRKFKEANPEVKLPPDYLVYESFQLNYEKYYSGGRLAAIWLKDKFSKYIHPENAKILDWGCGPARVVRHFPEILPHAEIFGTDYNADAIAWNRQNVDHVDFNLNTLEAQLPYADDFFDAVYGISIFTHLSEPKHYEWFDELYRVIRPGGILLLTLQGASFKEILSKREISLFDEGKLIVRGKVKEGHRTYSAFHPDTFVRNLCNKMVVLEHEQPGLETGKREQDVWILRKQ